MSGDPGSIKAMARCGECGHFASVHHGGGDGRPGGSSCAAPDCDCRKFAEANDARVPLDIGKLTAAEVAQLTGLSVHTLSYWRQSGQGPKTIKAGTRTLYGREDIEQWLASVDGRIQPSPTGASGWHQKAVAAANRIDPDHTAGCPQRTDGRLIKDNLWKEADVSRATMNRATQIMADWDTRVAACDSFTPREARKNDELTVIRADLAAKTRECTKLAQQLDAAATVIAALHHDNTLLRQELGQHGEILALNAHRTS